MVTERNKLLATVFQNLQTSPQNMVQKLLSEQKADLFVKCLLATLTKLATKVKNTKTHLRETFLGSRRSVFKSVYSDIYVNHQRNESNIDSGSWSIDQDSTLPLLYSRVFGPKITLI